MANFSMTNDTPKASSKFSDDQWHADNTAAGFIVGKIPGKLLDKRGIITHYNAL